MVHTRFQGVSGSIARGGQSGLLTLLRRKGVPFDCAGGRKTPQEVPDNGASEIHQRELGQCSFPRYWWPLQTADELCMGSVINLFRHRSHENGQVNNVQCSACAPIKISSFTLNFCIEVESRRATQVRLGSDRSKLKGQGGGMSVTSSLRVLKAETYRRLSHFCYRLAPYHILADCYLMLPDLYSGSFDFDNE